MVLAPASVRDTLGRSARWSVGVLDDGSRAAKQRLSEDIDHGAAVPGVAGADRG